MIGTVNAASNGQDTALEIDFNANSTPAAAQALLNAFKYSNTPGDPDVHGTAPARNITIILNDGGNTGSGRPLSANIAGTI